MSRREAVVLDPLLASRRATGRPPPNSITCGRDEAPPTPLYAAAEVGPQSRRQALGPLRRRERPLATNQARRSITGATH